MKNIYILKKIGLLTLGVALCYLSFSCDDDYLTEVPKDFLAPENTFVNKEGFEAGLTALYNNARGTHTSSDGIDEKSYEVLYGQGADIGFHIDKKNYITDYSIVNSGNTYVRQFWVKFYAIVKDANVIITRADSENAKWESEEEKNAIVAEAKFFRAYAYRSLVWYWGDVPIIREELTAPKLDFTRDPAADVLSFITEDLEFAAQHLPTENATGARLSKAAANYLLAENYIATQQWDKAIAASSAIINDPQYELMTTRFGSLASWDADPYWDLFRYGNQDRSTGNKENILAWQYEFDVDGGARNRMERAWGPFLERLKSPDNKQAILKDEFLGRPVVFIRITPWVETGMWDDFDGDMRNAEHNVQRSFYINNPDSAHFGELIEATDATYERNMFPYYKKFTVADAHVQGYDSSGTTYTDWYVFRVAGAYLLRAEAYLGKSDNSNAAKDINVVRARANATPVAAADVNIDYILDERARELLGEEDRRITLNRTGKLVERTKLHNAVSGPTMQDFHALFPIPQVEIDANKEAELVQNPGY